MDVLDLMDAINLTRVRVWKQQPAEFFEQSVIDALLQRPAAHALRRDCFRYCPP